MSSFFTIGHSNHAVQAWLAFSSRTALKWWSMRAAPLLEVCPQFDKELMQRSLEESGIRYLFLGAELAAGRPIPPTTTPKAASSIAGSTTMHTSRRHCSP